MNRCEAERHLAFGFAPAMLLAAAYLNTLRQRLGRFVRRMLSFSKTDQMHENCLRLLLHEHNKRCLTT